MAKEVTAELNLLPDETVIKRAEGVGYGTPISTKANDLILTNMALIHVKKTLFGKTKEAVRYPLSDIRVAGNSVEVKLTKPGPGDAMLDVYLSYGMERFKFTWEDEVEDWIADITETITGVPVPRKDKFANLGDFSELLNMAESVAGTMDHVRHAFGIQSNEHAVCKCTSCGASLEGVEGDTVECPYCGTHNKLVYKPTL
ncbi:MAG: hypothetical protein IJU77_00945 [Butyrivibrio sp.]|nr:hypothetical protein [Butyrivibrio sp.]